jgi:D-alanyl-D-alanine carboxypeptidase (penicillin-binding protein 5/6)
MISSRFWKVFSVGLVLCGAAAAQKLEVRSMDPYYGAVVIDAATGQILKEDHASAAGWPASMVKLMNFYILFDDIKAGKLCLDEPVQISAEVSKIGGRQVWLKEGEVFPLEELVYAMMVHSANDAAAAVAVRVSGSREAHAARMTAKARELGLRNTVFNSVHGLPPSTGQQADSSSALDMALLCKALIENHPEVLHYSSIATRPFRTAEPVVQLTSSNELLGSFPGCDGLKTGYFRDGGFSMAVTAQRDGRRVIAVILGSKDKHVRNAKAAEWLETGFARLPPLPPPPPPEPVEVYEPEPLPPERGWLSPLTVGLAALILGVAAIWVFKRKA